MPRTRFRFRDWFQVLNWESRISSPIPVLRTISITKKHFFVHFLRVKTAKIVWIRSGARISIPVPIPVPHPSKSDSDTGSGSRIIKSLIPSPIPVLKSLKIRVRFRDRDESLTESLGVSVPRRENRESLPSRIFWGDTFWVASCLIISILTFWRYFWFRLWQLRATSQEKIEKAWFPHFVTHSI